MLFRSVIAGLLACLLSTACLAQIGPYDVVPAPTQGRGVSPDTPVLVAPPGSTGLDFSANAPAITGTPLVTIPATAGRAYVEVQNQSANQLQLVRDDGQGNNVTSILLAGTGAGQQGGGWSSSTFKGRVRVYGTAGSQVSAYQD